MAPWMHLDMGAWPASLGHGHLSQVEAAPSDLLFSRHASAGSQAVNDVYMATSFSKGAALATAQAPATVEAPATAEDPATLEAPATAEAATAVGGGVPTPAPIIVPGPRRKRMECTADGVCSCAEGHKCIQTWPAGRAGKTLNLNFENTPMDKILAMDPQYALGCPSTRAGNDVISTRRFNKFNTECVNDRCLCALDNDPDKGLTTEVIKIPSITGEAKTLKPRFPMPNLDDKFVAQVTGKKSDGTTISPEPLYFDATTWQHQFSHKYKKNMQSIMNHFQKEIKKLEGDINDAYKSWENDKTLDPKPGQEPTGKQLKANKEQGKLEERAADTFEQMHNFQMLCSKMESTAQRFGLADFGEAKDLNCHMDPTERDASFKALDKLTELLQAKQGVIAEPAKASILIDAWTAGPLAALAGVASLRPCPRPSRPSHHSRSQGNVHRKASMCTRRKASDFLASIDVPLTHGPGI